MATPEMSGEEMSEQKCCNCINYAGMYAECEREGVLDSDDRSINVDPVCEDLALNHPNEKNNCEYFTGVTQ